MTNQELKFEVKVAGKPLGVSTLAGYMDLVREAIERGDVTSEEAFQDLELRLYVENK